jgi:CDP-diglyceride synthetase
MTSFGRIGPDHAVSLNQLAGPLSVSLMATWVGFAGGVVGVGLLIATGFVLYSERQKPGD